MNKKMQLATKWLVFLTVPIVSCVIVGSLMYYISIWYSSSKLLVINQATANGYTPLIIATFLSVVFNIGLTIYYSRSLKKVERLMTENLTLSELVLKVQMKHKDEFDELVKGGVKVD